MTFHRRDALSQLLLAQAHAFAATLAKGMATKLERDQPDLRLEPVALAGASPGKSRYAWRPKRRPGKYSVAEWGRGKGKQYPYASHRQGYH